MPSSCSRLMCVNVNVNVSLNVIVNVRNFKALCTILRLTYNHIIIKIYHLISIFTLLKFPQMYLTFFTLDAPAFLMGACKEASKRVVKLSSFWNLTEK